MMDERDGRASVIKTADDAIISKLSACSNGYINDPFLSHFAKNASGINSLNSTATTYVGRSIHPSKFIHPADRNEECNPVNSSSLSNIIINQPSRIQRNNLRNTILPHHQPIICRGTYARVCVMDHAISSFLHLLSDRKCCKGSSDVEAQIVLLGSGMDTTFLRSQCGLLNSTSSDKIKILHNVRWYEIDYPSVIERKRNLLLECPLLKLQIVQTKDKVGASFLVKPISISVPLHNNNNTINEQPGMPYHLVSHDLRNSPEELLKRMCNHHSFQLDIPTLFVLECVQMYLPGLENDSRDLLKTISQFCQQPIIAIYDPILLSDPFGKVMEANLTKAGVVNTPSSCIQTRTLQSQVDKLSQCGFNLVTACDMLSAYESVMSENQRQKANMCQMLDEIEEWVLIMKHYCFIVAGKNEDRKMIDRIDNSDHNSDFNLAKKLCAVGPSSHLGFPTKSISINR